MAYDRIGSKTRVSVNKQAIKDDATPPDQPYIAEGLYPYMYDSGGFCLLSLDKMRRKGEFYSNPTFNNEFRRKFNLTVEQINNLIYGYNIVRAGFKTRKSMVKYLKRLKAKERLSARNN